MPKGSRKGKGGKWASKGRDAADRNGVDYRTASKEGCSSGKWAWQTRAGAKTLVKALRHQGDSKVREYRCPECDRWHVGHLPVGVAEGRVSSAQVYARKRQDRS